MKNKLIFIVEIVIPIIIGIIISMNAYTNSMLNDSLESLITDSVNILATLFGFILASLSILLGFEGNEKTKQIRDSKHYKRILGMHIISDIWMFLGMIILISCRSFGIVNNLVAFMYIFIYCVSFLYLSIVLFYLTIMLCTLFRKKKKYN